MATFANSTTNTPLSRLIIGRTLNKDHYIGPKVFTPEPSEKEFGKFHKWDESRDFDRTGNLERLDGGPAVEVKGDYSEDSFTCKTIAVKNKISDKFIRNADPAIKNNHKKGMSLSLSKLLWKDREQVAADMLADSANFSGKTRTLAGTSQWSDYDNSTPWEDIGSYAEALEKNCEEPASFVYMGREVITKLMYHPDTLALLKDTEYKAMTPQAFSKILQIQLGALKPLDIYIGRSVRNTAAAGATAVNAFQHGKTFVLGYQNPDAGILYQETFAKMFYPTDIGAATVEEYRLANMKALFIEVEMTFGFKIVSNDCAQQALSVIA